MPIEGYYISAPTDVNISYPEPGLVQIESKRFVYTTLTEFKDKALLDVGWFEACYDKLHLILGIEPEGSDKIGFKSVLSSEYNFYVGYDSNNRQTIFRPCTEKKLIGYYFDEINETTRPCENINKEARTAAHELTHVFSSLRHPLSEGLAQWGMVKSSDPGFEKFICQDHGVIWQHPVGYPLSEWGMGQDYYNYSMPGNYSDSAAFYRTQYCIWKKIEEGYGEETVRKIIRESIDKNMSQYFGDTQLKAFFNEIVIPNTDPSFKDVLINSFGYKNSTFETTQ